MLLLKKYVKWAIFHTRKLWETLHREVGVEALEGPRPQARNRRTAEHDGRPAPLADEGDQGGQRAEVVSQALVDDVVDVAHRDADHLGVERPQRVGAGLAGGG